MFCLEKVQLVIILILLSGSLNAQHPAIVGGLEGYIHDANGVPIEMATVTVEGTHKSAATDELGHFTLSDIPIGRIILHITALGYHSRTLDCEITAYKRLRLDIVCEKVPTSLSPVIITAEKKTTLLQRTPSAIAVLNATQIERSLIWNLSDMGSYSPNVHVQLGSTDQPAISIRGIVPPGGASFDQPVAVYLDGVLQYDVANTLNQLYDVERIEVLRGPQGTLYGRNAMSGVINIITKQPVPGQPASGFVEGSIGNYGSQRYAAGVRLPIKHNVLTAGVSAFYRTSHGYFRNAYDGSRFDGDLHTGGNVTLKFLPNERWDVLLDIKSQYSSNNGLFPYIVYKGADTRLEHVTRQDTTGVEKRQFWNASLSIKNSNRFFEVTSISSYQHSNRFVTNGAWDFDWTTAAVSSLVYIDDPRDNASTTLSQEIRFNNVRSRQQQWSWTAGLFSFYHQRKEIALINAGLDAPQTDAPYQLRTPLSYYNSGIAFFGQISYTVLPKLTVTAGIRHDQERKLMHTQTDLIKEGTPAMALIAPTSLPGHYQAISPKVNISYQANPSLLVYANYARGFRAGGLNNRTLVSAFYAYDPEFTTNWEIGLKSTLFRDRLIANLTAFHIDWKDMQVAVFLPGATTDVALRNAGRANSNGLELELQSTPFKGFEVQYALGVTSGRYRELSLPDVGTGHSTDMQGKRMVVQPRSTAMLTMQYTRRLTASISAFVRLEWNHIGDQYFDVANTIRQRPYSLFNARMGGSYRKFDLAIWGRNLLNQRYISSIFSSGSPFVMLGLPATYGMTVTAKF